jgi:cytochrome c-type biogenesis protein
MEVAAGLSIPVALAAGLISFFSPCVLPLVPSYISVISGLSYVELRRRSEMGNTLRSTIFLKSLLFILGFSVVFMALGASFSLLGQTLGQYRMMVTKVGGILIVLFGLYTAGFLKFGALMREFHLLQASHTPAGILGPFLVGLSFGCAWTPCVGPTLGAILTLASVSDNLSQGTSLLAAYTAGLALPFLLSSLALNAFLSWFSRVSFFLPLVQKVGGLVLVVMGVLLFTGYLTVLNSYAISITPQWLWRWL